MCCWLQVCYVGACYAEGQLRRKRLRAHFPGMSFLLRSLCSACSSVHVCGSIEVCGAFVDTYMCVLCIARSLFICVVPVQIFAQFVIRL